jgi:hypothetical protein
MTKRKAPGKKWHNVTGFPWEQQLNEQRSALDKQFQNDPSSADYPAQIKALDEARDREYQRVLGANVFDTLQKEQVCRADSCSLLG